MESIIELLQSIVHHAAEIGIVIAEVIGISILIMTAIKCFVKYFHKDEHVRLELAQGIALALEFKLGGEVLHTVTVSQDDWMALLFLGGIIALRAVLTLLLHWEIKIEEEHERLEMLDHENDMMAEKIARNKAVEAEEAAQK
ncbi:MAG: DUF1622 domain-containing protein [Clostridia bacterium]|nr:DUF1622 domain-containing protein [Clostridia bacterium]